MKATTCQAAFPGAPTRLEVARLILDRSRDRATVFGYALATGGRSTDTLVDHAADHDTIEELLDEARGYGSSDAPELERCAWSMYDIGLWICGAQLGADRARRGAA